MIAQPPHGLGLAGDADAGGRVQALGSFGDAQDRLDDGEGYVAVEDGVVCPVDALLAALAKELDDLVAAGGKGRGYRGGLG